LGNVTDSASTTSSLTVSVSAVDDAPSLVLGSASGAEDTAIPLNISATSTGGVDVTSVTITGVPAGATLSAGTYNADTGAWTVDPADLASLTITPPADYSGAFDLNVTATAADGSVSTGTATVDVTPVADTPTVAAADVAGAEDTAIALDISSAVTDVDGSETLSIQISGIPDGAILVSGTDTITLVGDVATLTPDQLADLKITPPENFNGSFDLMVTSTSTDGTDTAVNNTTFTVEVAAVDDAADLSASDAAGLEDNAIALEITAEPTGGVAVDSIVIGGVPEGATLSAGTFNAQSGEWTLSPQELTGLTVTPPVNFSGSFDLNITAVSADGGTTQATTTVAVEAVADAPTLTVSAGAPTQTVDGGTTVTPSDYSDIQFGAADNDDDDDDDDDQGGQNNGFGNGDQDAPGNSGSNNNAENDEDDDGRSGGGNDKDDDDKDDDSKHGDDDKDDDDKDDDDDKTDGSSKDDVLIGSNKDDEIDGKDGDDLIAGKDGDDVLIGGDDDDVIFGGAGDDEIDGEDGDDILFGGSGDDTISGGDGDDFLIGGSGNDTLDGGKGDDVIVAGSGNDAIDGGSGDDTLVFSGSRDEYLITEISSDKGGSQYIVEHLGGGEDGINLVESIETFQFSDGQYSLEDMLASNPTDGGEVTLTYDITIETGLTDTDGSETLSDVTITGVPSGATLSAGTYDADSDSWTLGSDDLSGLTMQVTQEVSADFSLTVSVTSTEPNGDAATTTSSIDIALPEGFADEGGASGSGIEGDTSTDALDPLAVMFEDANTLTFEGEQYDISELTAGDSKDDYGDVAPLGTNSNSGGSEQGSSDHHADTGDGYSSTNTGSGGSGGDTENNC
jgi:hypothetical protein